jgi:hypothetical protein
MNEIQVKIDEASGFLKTSLEACRLDFTGLTPIDTKREVGTVVNLVVGLKDVSDCSRYLQGGLIVQLSDESRWKHHSDDSKDMSWPEFCENVLGVSIRDAQYKMKVYRKAGQLGLDPELIEDVGWTKCKELMRVATQESIDEWIEKARAATTRELTEEITKISQETEKDRGNVDADLSNFSVKMTPEQRQNVEAAMEDCQSVAKADGGKVYNRGDILDLIVTDWRANHIKPKARSLEWHLKQIRRAYKVEVEIKEPGLKE